MVKEEKQTNGYAYIAIVAIVAVIAVVMMFSGGSTEVKSKNLAGNAIKMEPQVKKSPGLHAPSCQCNNNAYYENEGCTANLDACHSCCQGVESTVRVFDAS